MRTPHQRMCHQQEVKLMYKPGTQRQVLDIKTVNQYRHHINRLHYNTAFIFMSNVCTGAMPGTHSCKECVTLFISEANYL